MTLILSIETATESCSVALHGEGRLIGNIELLRGRSTAEMLTSGIQSLLHLCKVGFADLSAVAVSKGPGSYTGLRIGVSTAKGLAYALDLPLLSVNTLDAMVAELRVFEPGAWLCPMLDARRMEVYCKLVSPEREIMGTSALVVDKESFGAELKGRAVLFFGPGAAKCEEVLKRNLEARFLPQAGNPKAAYMGAIAHRKYCSGDIEDLAAFEPFYLKEFMGSKPGKSKKIVT